MRLQVTQWASNLSSSCFEALLLFLEVFLVTLPTVRYIFDFLKHCEILEPLPKTLVILTMYVYLSEIITPIRTQIKFNLANE